MSPPPKTKRLDLLLCNGRLKCVLHCVSKNDTDVAHYNFDADQPIIFGADVAARVCYQTVICYPTSPN